MFGLAGLKLYIGLGMVLALVLLGAADAVLHARIAAKEAEIAGLTDQLGLASADVKRWQQSAEQRQGVIDRQSLTLRRLESDGQAARALAAANTDKATQRIAALEAKLAHLKEAAHANPNDVRPLGPIVRNALQSGTLGGLQH
jgi:chromosome segregation ATPase